MGAVTTDVGAGVAVVEILSLDPDGALEAVRVGKPVEGFAPSDRGVAKRAWINAYSVKRDGADVVAYRPLVVSADARLSLLGEGGKMLWSREESLALADEVMFARLPPPKTAAAAKADDLRVRPSFQESLRTQVLAVKARIKRATADEMAELFRDLPEAVTNTLAIAEKCDFELHMGENFLPNFEVPEGQTVEQHFREVVEQGFEWRRPLIDGRPVAQSAAGVRSSWRASNAWSIAANCSPVRVSVPAAAFSSGIERHSQSGTPFSGTRMV